MYSWSNIDEILLQNEYKFSTYNLLNMLSIRIGKTVEKCLARSRILLFLLEAGMLSNLVFSDKKKFDIQHHVNPQNDHVWSRDGEVGLQRVTQAQGAASVMVWAPLPNLKEVLWFS